MASEMKVVILATDLTNHFRYRAKLLQVCRENIFVWDDSNHRTLLKANMITCCDLAGQCKPYAIAKKITECLYSEFCGRLGW